MKKLQSRKLKKNEENPWVMGDFKTEKRFWKLEGAVKEAIHVVKWKGEERVNGLVAMDGWRCAVGKKQGMWKGNRKKETSLLKPHNEREKKGNAFCKLMRKWKWRIQSNTFCFIKMTLGSVSAWALHQVASPANYNLWVTLFSSIHSMSFSFLMFRKFVQMELKYSFFF